MGAARRGGLYSKAGNDATGKAREIGGAKMLL
jgi:hypothetical protein